jgi:beta-N-acetylhexosaminidase
MTAACAGGFAAGLADAGVIATMKHFPGLGYAKLNTDSYAVTIKESKKALASELLPYRNAIKTLPMIMLSNATYAAYDPANGAGWSRAVSVTLLRDQLGFNGVTITDSLSGTAAAQGVSINILAARAAAAGTDMILVCDSETSTSKTFSALMMAAMVGYISRATLLASYTRILALKTSLK